MSPARSPVTGGQLTLVIGDDALALSTAAEICRLPGHCVALLGGGEPDFSEAAASAGITYVAGRPDDRATLERAGVGNAATIIAVSRDDQLNLHAALQARDANPRIRIVLRQFNRTLAHKIAQNLPDCAVLSLAWHSAASYAATALDPTCFRGLQFPEPNGPLTGFAERVATDDDIVGRSVAQLEEAFGVRVVAINGDTTAGPKTRIHWGAQLCLYGEIGRLIELAPRPTGNGGSVARSSSSAGRRWIGWHLLRANPYLWSFAGAAFAIFFLGTIHFRAAFHVDWLTAAYFVLATMTTTGYGDMTPDRGNVVDVLMAMLLMLSGIAFTGVFIAFAASMLTRAQWVRAQGLRRVNRRGHIVVCGAGSIGSGVIELLVGFGKKLVVVEAEPDPTLVERARDFGFDLLTGDASRDETLDLCNLDAAHSLIALTNVDTLNLEIALGARARNPSMPIVLRIADASFAASIARHFDFRTTYSAAALAAPAFAGLAHMPGARGRITLDDREFAVTEYALQNGPVAALPRGTIALAVARNKHLALIRDLSQLRAGDRVLALTPLVQSEDVAAPTMQPQMEQLPAVSSD